MRILRRKKELKLEFVTLNIFAVYVSNSGPRMKAIGSVALEKYAWKCSLLSRYGALYLLPAEKYFIPESFKNDRYFFSLSNWTQYITSAWDSYNRANSFFLQGLS